MRRSLFIILIAIPCAVLLLVMPWSTAVAPGTQRSSAVSASLQAPPTQRAPTPTPLPTPMGNVYAVAPNGDDSHAGTLDAPFRTISKAASVVHAGDTVLVRGGQYHEQVSIYASGTPNARITFAAYPGEEPVIDGSDMKLSKDDGLVEIGEPANQDDPPLNDTGNYVSLIGFTVQHSSGRGISLTGDNVELASNSINHIQQSGIIARNAVHATFTNNRIWDTVRANADHTSTNWPPALSVWESTDAVITGNIIHDNNGEGISVWKDTSRFRISNNTLYDNWSINLYLDNDSDSMVENNFIYETATAYIPRRDSNNKENKEWRTIASGIAIADEDYSSLDSSYSCNAQNIVIRNNVMVNVRNGLSFYRYIACSGLKNVLFEFNTIVDSWDYGVRVLDGNHADVTIRNNIVYSKAGLVLLLDMPGDTRVQNNMFYAADASSDNPFEWQGTRYNFDEWQARSNVTDNIWADPLLVERGAWRPEGQFLSARSPAIDHATDTDVASDFRGKPRPVDGNDDGKAIADIGAYEWQPPSASAVSPGTHMSMIGAATTLPGRIEAENYNLGGEGVGYHDTTPGNKGGAYRAGDVDIQACDDAAPCYNIGWTAAGEWLQYDVSVPQASAYTFQLRVASRYNDKQVAVEIAGQQVMLAAPNTGSWKNWASVTSAPVQLPAGTHTLRVLSVTGDVNIDYIDVQPAS